MMVSIPEAVLRRLPEADFGEMPIPDAPPRRRRMPMTLRAAQQLVLGSESTLYSNSKMPGVSFGLDAFKCPRGNQLAKREGSACSVCYARKNFYRTWWPVLISRKRRHRNLRHPKWVDAMTTLVIRYTDPAGDFFRWHDSGDLMGAWHLENLLEVCRRTPWVKHWLPTHEPYIVRQVLARGQAIPENLCIRISADFIGRKPKKIPGLELVQTSTIHRTPGKPVQVSPRRRHSIECRSYTRRISKRSHGAGECGKCRACWDRRVRNVSYLLHE
jgi:hypothetical protein